MSRTAWRLLAWLYAPARRIFVLDDGVTAELRAQGFDRNKITSLPRLAARPSRESPDSRQDSSGRYDWSVLVDAIWRQDPPLERSSDRPGVSTVTDDWPAVVADVS